MRYLSFLIVFLAAGCQMPNEKNLPLTVDAYYENTPEVKTAAIRLMNKGMSLDDLEFKQFFRKLKPLLESKGYLFERFSGSPAVILELDFGARSDGYTRTRSALDTFKESHPVDEPQEVITSLYGRIGNFKKYISLTAVDARDKKTQFWKTSVSETSSSPDFRAAEGKLLYLLSHFIEKESHRTVSANLSDVEYYQRYVLGYSPAEASPYLYVPVEVKNQYQRELQARVNAHLADFKKCGLTEKRQIAFFVSPFGTLPTFDVRGAFEITGSPLPEPVRKCIVGVFEPLLDVPLDIDTTQPLTVSIPVR